MHSLISWCMKKTRGAELKWFIKRTVRIANVFILCQAHTHTNTRHLWSILIKDKFFIQRLWCIFNIAVLKELHYIPIKTRPNMKFKIIKPWVERVKKCNIFVCSYDLTAFFWKGPSHFCISECVRVFVCVLYHFALSYYHNGSIVFWSNK